MGAGRRTDDAGEALIAWNGLAVVALAALEGLCEVHGGLLVFALEVELVDAALGDH